MDKEKEGKMTQRIFDIYNEQDYADLWDILPDDVEKIKKNEPDAALTRYLYSDSSIFVSKVLKIDWHDKTEITRPVNYESMIGCVGFFWDDYAHTHNVGVLTEYHRENRSPFVRNSNSSYLNFRPAKKSEIKFWGD